MIDVTDVTLGGIAYWLGTRRGDDGVAHNSLKLYLVAAHDSIDKNRFIYFLPSPCLTCCAILSTSFGGTDSNWGDDWSHSIHRRSLSWVFPGISSAKVNARISVHRPRCHLIIIITISERRDWSYTRPKWPWKKIEVLSNNLWEYFSLFHIVCYCTIRTLWQNNHWEALTAF